MPFTYLRRLNNETRLFLVKPVENFKNGSWVGLHHVDQEVGALEVAPVGVQDVERLCLEGFVVVSMTVDVHLQAVLRVHLLYEAWQALKEIIECYYYLKRLNLPQLLSYLLLELTKLILFCQAH